MGIKILDRVRSVDERNELEIPLIDKIEQGQLRWFRHLFRMKHGMPAKEIWEAKTQRRRVRSRPARTLNENLEEIMKRQGLYVTKARKIANDKKWKEIYGRTRNVILEFRCSVLCYSPYRDYHRQFPRTGIAGSRNEPWLRTPDSELTQNRLTPKTPH